MKKETEDLLRNYWYEGYRFVFITFDNAVFVTNHLYGSSTKKEYLLGLSNHEAVYLPIEELKNLFSESTRSTTIKGLVKVCDWGRAKVDTPVMIHKRGSIEVIQGHFKEFIPEDKKVAVFKNGRTSWTNGSRLCDYLDIDEVTLP